ncbi:hypothetical protein DH2020_010752 [Rehmannia glutinosa]|uniref:Uncharacterized protein n=1 Tax=Rehmannia glutinosa TaxID=99300 RepID=A0ABR0XBG6_REHGL
MEAVRNKYVVTRCHIDGAPNESDFSVCEQQISLKLQYSCQGSDNINNVVLVKTLYASIDPAHLNRMKTRSFTHTINPFSAVIPGQVIGAVGVGRVVDSRHPDFKTGDLVSGWLSWAEYTIVTPASQHMEGYSKFANPKRARKCLFLPLPDQLVDLLKETIGFDAAFNYKEETNFNAALQRYLPEGIDIYFDNVGGEMLEAAVQNMNLFGRIAVCGVISEYTDTQKKAKPDMVQLIYKRIKIEGFLAIDLNDIYPEFISTTVQYLQTGKLKVIEDMSYGVESIPSAFVDIFRGNNIGKKVVKIAED